MKSIGRKNVSWKSTEKSARIKENIFQTVEGEISACETDSTVVKFEIGGLKFEYSDRDMMLGYNQIKE